jgi:ATP-dependent helicase/DNAse subunit B
MAAVTVLTGSHLSSRRARIDEILQQHWGRAILLLPSNRLAQLRRDQYLASTNATGMLGAPFKTFDQFASDILEQEGDCAETLSDFQRGLLVQEVVQDLREAGGLGPFDAACATPGFSAHVLRIITQLKQAGIDHNQFAEAIKTRPHASGFDPIVSAVYKGYQKAVIETEVYDRVGVIWQAETFARNRTPVALSTVDALILDTFDDFTPSELRLIDALRVHVSELVFGFSFNVGDASYEDLYALPRATSRRVCTIFDVPFPEPCEEKDPATFSMFAAQHLFWRSPPPSPPQSDQNLALVEYRDAWNEIESTGRSIKSLLLDGVAPESIAVLHRDISDAALTIHCVFTEFGIPAAITADAPLRESAIATFLVEVLEASDAWEHDRIAGILTSPWFSGAASENFESETTFLLARAAGVIQGHRDWSRGLESLQDRLSSSNENSRLSGRLTNPAESCGALREAVSRLYEIMELIPTRAHEAKYVDALIDLLDALGLDEVLAEMPDDIASTEVQALSGMSDLFRNWQAWCQTRKPGPPIARSEFVARLRKAMRDTPAGIAGATHGVWCASMDDARHVSFAHVFIIGMNEGSVPRPAPVNAIYGHADLEAFADQHIELDSHQRHTEREMLLLHRCMSAAEKRLTVSWHAVDAAGKSRAPSPFIADIKSIAPDSILVEPGERAFAPAVRAASPRDLAASILLTPDAEAALNADYVERFNAGAAVERARLDSSPFALYDGVVLDQSLLPGLANYFGDAHTFSVNQFETYASCPFRFYMDRVLSIPEDLPPEVAIDPRDRGQVLHNILRGFHEHFAGKSAAEIPDDDMLATLDECIEGVFEPLSRFGSPHTRTLWRVERGRARKILIRHLRTAAAKDDAQWKPQQFEVAFGRARRDEEANFDRLDDFVLDTTAGPIRFSGQIDRIDRAGEAVRIVDYKSSLHLTKKAAQSAESLQLPIYGLAWDATHEALPCREASFVEIGTHKKVDAFTAKEDWDSLADDVRVRVGQLAQGIRAGYFPPEANKGGCASCSARRVCRYEQGRIERKQGSAT